MPSQAHTDAAVTAVSQRLSAGRTALDAAVGRVADLEPALADARAAVSDLMQAKAEASSREERRFIREELASAKAHRSRVVSDLAAARGSVRAAQADIRRAASDGRTLYREIRGDQARLGAGAARIRGGAPADAVSHALGVAAEAGRGLEFESRQLQALSRALAPSRSESELEYVYEMPDVYALTSAQLTDGRLHLVEAASFGEFETADRGARVRTEQWMLFDTLDTGGLRTEQKGLLYAEGLLREHGHSVVFALGGPSLPDMLSLSGGELFITEVKGTEVSGHMTDAMRDRKYADGSSMKENSPSWLLRDLGGGRTSVTETLAALDAAIRAATARNDPAEALGLRQLQDSYRDAARTGFSPVSCVRQVVQVGFQSDGDLLKPPETFLSQRLDAYVREAAPDVLIQVNVLSGSAAASAGGDSGPAHSGGAAPTGGGRPNGP